MFRKMLARPSGDVISRDKGTAEKQALLDEFKGPEGRVEIESGERARREGEMDGVGEEETLAMPAKPPW